MLNIKIDKYDLSNEEELSITNLLAQQDPKISDDLEQIWYLMDMIWSNYGCDNIALNWNKIGQFYSDPVWLLNGFFIEQHPESMQHRHAISGWIQNNCNPQVKIIDYGGGFGTLAIILSSKCSGASIDIFEPHPSNYALRRIKSYKNTRFIDKLESNNYDVLVSTDVLEHVENPLDLLQDMVGSVKLDGYLIIQNCFYPVIKCHLPCTFYLRNTFDVFCKLYGLQKIGLCDGSGAVIYQKKYNTLPDKYRLKLYIFYAKVLNFCIRLKNKINFLLSHIR
jgi:2-polyprenyl-6-hydroxyphenyl methylase/3-demethylubiquinone-9 3-methyltransferase